MQLSQLAVSVRSTRGRLMVVLSVCIVAFFCLCAVSFCSQEAAYRFNEEGVAKLNNKDYPGAIKAFKQAQRYEPANTGIKKNLAITYNNYGFYLMGTGDNNGAIEKYEYALSYDPDNEYTLYNLGQAYYQVQKVSRAKEYLEKAHRINSDLEGVKFLLDKINLEEKAEREFDEFETMHFIIAASPDIDISRVSYIKTYLEEAYGRIGKFLGRYPKERTVVVLYSEGDYEQMLEGKPHWAIAVFDGKMRIPVHKFKYTTQEVVQIIYHEYAHVLIHDITGGDCPLWLNEGIASWAEDFVYPKKSSFMRLYIEKYGLIPFTSIPLDFTSINDQEIATLMYVESYLLVDYIISRFGFKGLQSLLDWLAADQNIDAALEDVFKESLNQFEEKWEQFIVREYQVKNLK